MASIKEKLHNLIETIQDESLLNQIYELVYKKSATKEGDLWAKLSSDQQNEIMQSLEESKDPENLISNEEVKKLHKGWL